MSKVINYIDLALRATLFLFLPVYLLINQTFQFFFNSSLSIMEGTVFYYLLITITWLYDRYKKEERYIALSKKEEIEKQLRNGPWEESDRRGDTLIIRPTFDSPYRFMLNDKVTIRFDKMRIVLTGPLKYIKTFSSSVTKSEEDDKRTLAATIWRIVVVTFISYPFLRESRVMTNINMLRHNAAADSSTTEIITHEGAGNSAQNINNQGMGVSSDDNFVFAHGSHSIIRTNHDLEHESLLVDTEGHYGAAGLNIAGDWLYYTDTGEIKRIRLDGSDQETLYDIGQAVDLHLVNDRLYFMDYSSNFNIFSMDLNGHDLKRVVDIEAMDLTVYEDELLVSIEDGGIRFSPDGRESEQMIEEYGSSILRYDDHYYYLDGEYYLTSQSVHSSTPRIRTRVLERPVDRYTISGDTLFYVQDSGVFSNVDRGLFRSDFDGGNKERIHPSGDIYRLTIVGDYLLFELNEDYEEPVLMSYNMKTGELDELYE